MYNGTLIGFHNASCNLLHHCIAELLNMKTIKDGDIASLFLKAAAKNNISVPRATAVASALPSIAAAASALTEEEEGNNTTSPAAAVPEDVPPVLPPSLPPPAPPPVYDPDRLPQDPADRLLIVSYPVNDQDAVRRAYIIKGSFKPYAHQFKKRKIGTRDRSFNPIWLHKYNWLEYNIKNDAAFCFICYLFKNKKGKGKGTKKFTIGGWRNWNREDALDKHVGGVGSIHNAALERYILYLTPAAKIDKKLEKVDSEDLRLYKIRLTYSLRCLKFLLHQGLAFRGHNESEASSNRGNFLELLTWLASNSEEVDKHVLTNAPSNCTLTCPDIQKQIIQCCAIETRNKIIQELGDDHYAILDDESSDISHKEHYKKLFNP